MKISLNSGIEFSEKSFKSRFLLPVVFSTIILAAFSCNKPPEKTALKWPEITNTTQPWSRWWWMGNAVDKKNLTALMKDYKAHGLGGLEITPIYGVKGDEDQFIQYLSPKWMEMFQYTLDEARKLGLGIDMDNTASWPFGGPWVGSKDESKSVFYKTYTLTGGQKLSEPIVYRQKALVSTNGHRVGINDIKQPLSANKDMQQLSLFQVIFPREIPLSALVAYSDSGDIVRLKDKVDAKGHLNWIAPKGNWTLYAIFEGWHGKMVERAAPGGEGFVIDPFSKQTLLDYLSPFDSAFKGHDVGYARAFFQDSYEFDDGYGQADWTPEFFEDFNTLRGYDLRDHLPALFGKSTEEENQRVIADYRATISDLLLTNFTETWRKWAKGHNAIIRNQAHGSPANILDLYGASDIPETEGYDPIKIRFAASAGHVAGRQLISSESCTWMNEHFLGTLAEAKETVNRFLLNGVNHIFYHGTTYSPEEAPWPGWLFYAAVDFSPSNSFWDDFKALNDYIARSQSFLQKGKPDNDVLVYYPVYDYWSRPGKYLLEHFDGSGKGRLKSDFFILADSLLEKGYTYDFISDEQLGKTRMVDKKIETDGGAYKTIVVPQSRFMPLPTMKKLVELAKKGATIILHESFPEDVPGWNDLDKRRKEFKNLLAQLHFETSSVQGIEEAAIGKGKFIMGSRLSGLLSYAGIQRETMVDGSLQFIRRRIPGGTYYFVVNKSSEKLSKWVPLETTGAAVAIFNPQTGTFGMGNTKKQEDAIRVYLQLQPGEAGILKVFDHPVTGAQNYPYYQLTGEAQALAGTWKVNFLKGGPALPHQVTTSELTSWTDFDQEGVKAFSGTARYSISFPKPDLEADAWQLDLGKVFESARVKLNGSYQDTLIAPPYQVVIPVDSLKEQNILEVEVSNLMANRIADMDKKGAYWKKFYNVNFPAKFKKNQGKEGLFDASKWEPRASGLVGPVTLTPLKRINPQ